MPNPEKKIHSKYEDGTPVFEDEKPTRLPTDGSKPIPFDGNDKPVGAHSQLRLDKKNNRIYQAREFDIEGNPVRDIDFTIGINPNTGKPRPNHNLPGVHKWIPNNPNNLKAGFKRSKKDEPLKR